jgi:glutamine cyclotransferase
MRIMVVVLVLAFGFWLTAYALSQRLPERVPNYSYVVIREYPHDPAAFTQGLVYKDGFLYEGTGLNGQSTIRKAILETGQVVQRAEIGSEYFGEGIVIWKTSLIQLTWTTNIGFVYDLATFSRKRTFGYRGEGWGITHDGQRLIMSDGTSNLRYLNPETLQETGKIAVRDGTRAVTSLNELEFVKGEIFANIWQTDRIARIQPSTGKVVGWIHLGGLLKPADRRRPVDVLNGIAYDATNDRLFVTGKLWPKIFEIRITPASP